MKNLNQILEQIAELSGLVTSKEAAIKNNQDNYLQLEYASVYGGYRLVNVSVKNGGHSGAFGESASCARLSNKEMTAYLNALLNGLKYDKQ